MSVFKSEDNKSCFGFNKTDSIEANGRKSVAFDFEVTSHTFSARLGSVWFEEEDIEQFHESISRLISGEQKNVNLRAMSDFELDVSAADSTGHFEFLFKLASPLFGNRAQLTVSLVTQSVDLFANEMKASVSS